MPEETRICIPGSLAFLNYVCMKSRKHWKALASGCPVLERAMLHGSPVVLTAAEPDSLRPPSIANRYAINNPCSPAIL